MSGTISEQCEVNIPASEAWKLYGTLQLAKMVEEALPNVISGIDLIQGDGKAGTILQLHLPPAPGLLSLSTHTVSFYVHTTHYTSKQ